MKLSGRGRQMELSMKFELHKPTVTIVVVHLEQQVALDKAEGMKITTACVYTYTNTNYVQYILTLHV